MHTRPSNLLRDLAFARDQLRLTLNTVVDVPDLLMGGDDVELSKCAEGLVDHIWQLAEAADVSLSLTKSSLADEASQLAKAFEVFTALGWCNA